MKSILLFDTAAGSLNQGDEIINYSIKKNWPELFERNYIFKMPSHVPTYTWYQYLIYKDRFKALKDSDYKFFCGTNALYTNMLRPMPTWNINIFNTALLHNTICIGTGIGINSKKVNYYTRKLYSKVLSSKYIHSVRDEKTKLFLENLGYKAIVTGCPTLWGLTAEHCNSIPRKKSSRVVFTLNYINQDAKNDKAMINILLDSYREVFFWPQCVDDYIYLNSLNINNGIKIVAPNLMSYEKLLQEGNIDYVGNRLHGGIFAMQNFSRTIIISIDYRAEEMHKMYTFTCIKREMIPSSLKGLILGEWETIISGLHLDVINEWKAQFDIDGGGNSYLYPVVLCMSFMKAA